MKSLYRKAQELIHSPRSKALAYIGVITIFALTTIGWGYQARHQNDPSIRGVSFSTKYAAELGLDWQQTMLALLDDVGVQHFRLMSYWDTVEFGDDVFDFQNLDWQIDQVARHDGTVSLAIGQRQPRWPECHIPNWALELETEEYNTALIGYIEETVTRYKDNPAITSYQLENEAANRHFGDCPLLDEELLARELATIQRLDPDTPIIINASNQSGTPLFGPTADSVGYSIYKKAGFEAAGRFWQWNFWYVPSTWHSFRAALSEGIKNTDTFIHELQAEPWGPEATVNLSDAEQRKTMDAQQLKNIVAFADDTAMRTMYLWGGEWWYWRLTQFNDTELWETVKEVYAEPTQT